MPGTGNYYIKDHPFFKLDERDPFVKDSPVHLNKLQAILDQL